MSRLLVFDTAERSFVGASWKVGATLFQGGFDRVVPAASSDDVLDAVAESPDGGWDEIQLWGHGGPGAVYVGGGRLDLASEVWAEPRLVWWRCCSVLAEREGVELAEAFAKLGTDSAGHTRVIGTWAMHSGLVGLRADSEPWWNEFDGGNSFPFAPRTIPAWRMDLPRWAFEP